MRRLFFFIFLGISVLGAKAQPSVDGSQFTNVQTVLFYESASPDWSLNQNLIELTGENMEWDATDWSGLLPSEEAYYPISSLSAVYQFYFNNQIVNPQHFSTHAQLVPMADIGIDLPIEVNSPYLFYRNDETGYYNTGLAFSFQGFPIVTPYSLTDRIYKFPMNYGNADSSEIAYLISVPFLGAYGQNGTRYNEVDGWGELITPYGEYEVLRVRTERYLTDTVFIDQTQTGQSIERPVQIDYTWISPEVPGPILQISTVSDIVVSSRMLFDDSELKTSELSEQEITIHPNPAGSFINLSGLEGNGIFRIFNLQGSLCLSGIYRGQTINTEELESGYYFLSIEQEKQTINKPFTISE